MKKYKFLIFNLAIVISLLSSCQGMLEEEVHSQITDNYLNTALGFDAGLKAAYSNLRYYYGASSEITPSAVIFGTDEFTSGWAAGHKYMNNYDAGLNPRNSVTLNMWNNLYVAINTCNAVISRAPQVTGIADDLKKIRVAEARFLRAEYYFLLVQHFGPVHLSLEETQGIQTAATRVPISDIYKTIVEDLEYAVSVLPSVASNYGRATKPAAQNLLAKVYLTRASSEAKQATDYDKAAQLAKSVINDYSFKLLDNYSKVFEQGAGEKNSEVIFSVQYSKDMLSNGNGNNLHLMFLCTYDNLPGMKRDIANGRPWARYRPTDFVLQTLFDRVRDSRYESNFKRVYYCNNPGTYSINGKQVTLKLGDTAVYLPDREYTAAEIAKANYTVFPPSKQTDRVYPVLTKFIDPERLDVQETRGSRDFLLMRLSETYLIAAEALMMSGKSAEAADYVNTVRRRAAKIGATPAETQANRSAMEISPDQLNIDFILDERARELLGEMMRWTDLVRTGKLVERVKKYNLLGASNIMPYHVLRPIPQEQIDRTSTEFTQNKGYN